MRRLFRRSVDCCMTVGPVILLVFVRGCYYDCRVAVRFACGCKLRLILALFEASFGLVCRNDLLFSFPHSLIICVHLSQ